MDKDTQFWQKIKFKKIPTHIEVKIQSKAFLMSSNIEKENRNKFQFLSDKYEFKCNIYIDRLKWCI